MNNLDRAVVVLAAFLLLFLAALGVAGVFGWDAFSAVGRWLFTGRWVSGLLAAAFILAGLHLLFLGAAAVREPGITKETELGQVRISLRALEHFVRRAARRIEGIRDVEARVRGQGEKVDVTLSLSVLPEINIPALSDEVQAVVERFIRDNTGVEVGNIGVEVRNVTGEAPRPRVE